MSDVTASKTQIDRILEDPDAPNIAQQLQARLAAERAARHQFYNDINEDDKAEFINGEVVLHSPVTKKHNSITGAIYTLLLLKAREGFVGIEKIMLSLTRNAYEPDVVYFGPKKAAEFTEDQKLFPAPDLVVEIISKSTEVRDRGVKFKDYAAHEVGEYWLIDPEAETIEQYLLTDDKTYELHIKARTGELSCRSIPGLTFPIRACFDEAAHRDFLRQV